MHRRRRVVRAAIGAACTVVLAACGKPGPVASLEVVSDLEPAFGLEAPVSIELRARDGSGRPVPNARLSAVLLFGADEEKGVDATAVEQGLYRVSFGVPVAGPAILYAWDQATQVSVDAVLEVAPGPPAVLAMRVSELGPRPTRTWALAASVEDAAGNVIGAAAPDITWQIDAGSLKVDRTDGGTSRASLVLDRPGHTNVTAALADGTLTAQTQLQASHVELSCPPAVHLTGEPGEDRSIPVTLSAFAGPEKVTGYELTIRANELTSFAATGRGLSGFPQPTISDRGDGTFSISAKAGGEAGDGYDLTELDFACLGEGYSEIDVLDGSLYVADEASKGGSETIPIAYRDSAVCPNKRVKDLCVQPILVTGPQGAGVGKAAMTSRLQREVSLLQASLDSACCTIRVQLRDTKELAAPATYAAEVAENTDGDRTKVIQVEWDARSVGSQLPGEIRLSSGMKDLMCAPNVRDDECINIYIVKPDSAFGRYPAVPEGQQGSQNEARRTAFAAQGFGAADIKRSRLNVNGNGCETIRITERQVQNGQEVGRPLPATECQIDGIVIPADAVSEVPLAADTVQQAADKTKTTFRHEVGHLLGLRHPWEYNGATTQRIRADETNGKRSFMWYNDEASVFTKTECEMITAQNCNGLQRDRPQ